jgi:hypothetical protein
MPYALDLGDRNGDEGLRPNTPHKSILGIRQGIAVP